MGTINNGSISLFGFSKSILHSNEFRDIPCDAEQAYYCPVGILQRNFNGVKVFYFPANRRGVKIFRRFSGYYALIDFLNAYSMIEAE